MARSSWMTPKVDTEGYSESAFGGDGPWGSVRARRAVPRGKAETVGSGFFFMRRDIVVTAKHVITDRIDPNAPFQILQPRFDGTREGIRAIDWCPLDEVDAAMIRVDKTYVRISHPLFPSHYGMNNKKGFVALGYNRDFDSERENTWAVFAHHVRMTETQVRERKNSKEYVLHYDANWAQPGYSGGPIITEGGGVVALMIEMFAPQESSCERRPRTNGRATSIYPLADSFLSQFEYNMLIQERNELRTQVQAVHGDTISDVPTPEGGQA